MILDRHELSFADYIATAHEYAYRMGTKSDGMLEALREIGDHETKRIAGEEQARRVRMEAES